jgi:hypothetical protein
LKTNRLLSLLIGAFLAGNVAGCSDSNVVFQPTSPPPHIDGYNDNYWIWDEQDGEWEYAPPEGYDDGGIGHLYYYGGKIHKSSIKLTPGFKSASSISKTAGLFSGFGSKGGGFGG